MRADEFLLEEQDLSSHTGQGYSDKLSVRTAWLAGNWHMPLSKTG